MWISLSQHQIVSNSNNQIVRFRDYGLSRLIAMAEKNIVFCGDLYTFRMSMDWVCFINNSCFLCGIG